MNWQELNSIYEVALTQHQHGKTYSEIAAICGCTVEDIKRLFKKRGTGKHLYAKEQEAIAIELFKNDYTVKEVANKIGLSEGWVYELARKNDISPMTEVKREREQLIQICQQYKAKGLTIPEVAELLGINVHFVGKYCKGISPQNNHSYTKQLEKAKSQIAQYGFEYVGGYTNADSPVTIRCLKCGTVFERSMISIRHPATQTIVCPGCAELAREEKRKQEECQKAQAEQERILKSEEKKRKAEEKERARTHLCPVCGKEFKGPTNKKYCSVKCGRKALYKSNEIKRDRKIKGAMVDRDITLQRLYERDHGICYLCGEVCDWEDKEEKNGTIICGNRYPSIDHVVPLSRGGEHSWQNVRLAHRICNTLKGAKHQKIVSSPTISE